jgi:penicillin-binding protein 1C
LFQLFNAIDRNATSNSIDAPPGLRSRYVCSMSGRIPSELCTDLVMDTYIPGVSDNRPCDHLKTVYLSADEQFSFCTSCMPATGYKAQLFANIEPELAAFYDQRNIGYDKIPEHNPACSRYFGGAAPQINSLTNGSTYLITDKGKQQLQLGCAASGDVTKVYWYINDRFIGSCGSKEKIMFLPEAGRIKISCSDDKGRSVSIYVNVKFI